ncbi:MAG: hypothetical protein A4E69_01346 [Syntrophus sp. PtaB.Bin138]|nr:MAG: hypothetical protein A4E69_01346 [Syntrophus sp. PtaB.Bin138]
MDNGILLSTTFKYIVELFSIIIIYQNKLKSSYI